MLNSAAAKVAPQIMASTSTFLNKVLSSHLPARNFASVAFNVKSKFETAFEKKRATLDGQVKKEYSYS